MNVSFLFQFMWNRKFHTGYVRSVESKFYLGARLNWITHVCATKSHCKGEKLSFCFGDELLVFILLLMTDPLCLKELLLLFFMFHVVLLDLRVCFIPEDCRSRVVLCCFSSPNRLTTETRFHQLNN